MDSFGFPVMDVSISTISRTFNHLTGMARKHQLPRYKAENEYMACLEVGGFKPSRSDVFLRPLFDICAMLGCWMFNWPFLQNWILLS